MPESAKQAIERAREAGHLVFINSGRTYCLTGPIRSLLEVDGYCCGCGTRIVAGNDVIYSASIPHETGIKIKKMIVKYGLDGILEGSESCYFNKEESRIEKVRIMKEVMTLTNSALWKMNKVI